MGMEIVIKSEVTEHGVMVSATVKGQRCIKEELALIESLPRITKEVQDSLRSNGIEMVKRKMMEDGMRDFIAEKLAEKIYGEKIVKGMVTVEEPSGISDMQNEENL